MEQASRQVSKLKAKLPLNNLQQQDLKFVSELITYIGTINGRNELSVSLHDTFSSRFKIIVAQMPSITFDDIRQVELMCSRIKNISIDLQRGYFVVEAWKDGKEKKGGRKRERGLQEYQYDLPSTYNLKNVEDKDKAQVEGVLKMLIGMTELEFDIELESDARYYKLMLQNIELFHVDAVDSILERYRAFIPDVIVNYPAKQLCFNIRKTDTPLDKIAPLQKRKKVKVKHS